MRTSQITLLGALGVVAAIIVAVVIGVRMAVSGLIDSAAEAAPRDSDEFTELDLSTDLTGFDRIVVRSAWDIDINQGDEWSVEISVPQDVEERLHVGVDGDRLVLDVEGQNRPWWFGGGPNRENRATITLPDLAALEIQGMANVEFSEFTGDRLEIFIAGMANIETAGGRFDDLDVTVSGAGNVEFRSVPVTNARVNLSGASNVELRLDGGELTGNLSGLGNLEYSGTVSSESVNVSGFGQVQQRR